MAKQDTPGQGDFPMMGESLLQHICNLSGERSPYTKVVGKKTMGRGASPTGKYAKRGSTMIHEANGPKCTIVATLYKANAAEASATERNVRIVPSTVSRPDAGFWGKREYGQTS